ncbi:hypothetical protein ACULLB_05240 [Enterococcus gallinarum]|uniref:hypothetical protein n=1 Tax=Enterococcus gallinarum TaxID=1353 RepID=UPI00403FDB55
MSELLDAAIKAGDKIYFRGEKVESIEITRDKDEPPLKVDLAHTRASYLDTITEQLNENQQIVLEYLKGMCPAKLGVSAMVTAYCLVDDNINDNWQEYSDEIPEHIEALQELSVAEENQVLEVFANWALEQEEE